MNQDFIYLFLAGYGNSTGDHWQAKWLEKFPNSIWVDQKSWIHPVREQWVSELQKNIEKIKQPIVIIAHSLGCLTFVEWAKQYPPLCKEKVVAALLVAVPDPDTESFPKGIKGFDYPPLEVVPTKTLIVASTNDRYASIKRMKFFAKKWGSELIDIGEKGHINADSGLGEWWEGRKLLEGFLSKV